MTLNGANPLFPHKLVSVMVLNLGIN